MAREREREMIGQVDSVPILGKLFCSTSEAVLVVRKRPHMVGGGGFVVTDSDQKVVFKVDGCGILGTKGELVLRDADGEPLLLIRRKRGIVQALSMYGQWKGYGFDYEGSQKPVFKLKEPNSFCLSSDYPIRISIEPKGRNDWDFEVKGSFPDKSCTIIDFKGNIVAQIGVKEDAERLMGSKDLYHVAIKPGMDQAFVFGVTAVLDYIYNESTRC